MHKAADWTTVWLPDDVDKLEVEWTVLGYRFTTEDFDTMGYWQHAWWQTTIPYWAGLFGVV